MKKSEPRMCRMSIGMDWQYMATVSALCAAALALVLLASFAAASEVWAVEDRQHSVQEPSPRKAYMGSLHASHASGQPLESAWEGNATASYDSQARLGRRVADSRVCSSFENDPSWALEAPPLPEPTLPTAEPDREQPIYEVYKNGRMVDAPAEIQWMIHDMAEEYGFDEKIIFGMIVTESTFNRRATNENCRGLAQINPFWLKSKAVARFTDDPRSRDLYEPYDNLMTLMEIWCYARDAYGLETGLIAKSEQGEETLRESTMLEYTKLLYWHNTGKDPRKVARWAYAAHVFRYAEELVPVADEHASSESQRGAER